MTITRKSIAKGVFKLLIIIAAFAILEHNGAFDRELLESLSFTPTALIGIVFFPIGAIGLNALRWKLILERVGIIETTWNCARMILIGFFYNLVFPGGSGGDLVRIYSIARQNKERKIIAGLSVVFDRLYGILALGGMIMAGVLALSTRNSIQPGTLNVLFPLVFVIILACGYLVAPKILQLGFVKKRLFGENDNNDCLALWGKGWSGVLAICISVVIHICNVGLIMSSAWLVGYTEVPFFTWLAIAPLSFLVNQVPLTPGGIGLGETSLFSGLAQVATAANPGAVVFLIYRITFFILGVIGYLLPGSKRLTKEIGH